MDRQAFIDALFSRAAEVGFEASEVYISESDSFETEVIKGEIVNYSVSTGIGLGFRGLKDGKMGIASTQILDEAAIDLLIDGALENLSLIESTDRKFLYPGDDHYEKIDRYAPRLETITAAEKIAMAKALEEKTLAGDPRITRTEGAGIVSETVAHTLNNSLGLKLYRRENILAGYVVPVAEDGEKVATGMAVFSTQDPDEIDIDKTAAEAVEKALRDLYAEQCPSETMRVMFDPRAARKMLATFSGIFSADAAQKGLSLLKGKEGTVIAADCVTLRDDPHMEKSIASKAFDDEGVATCPKNVIENGRLTTLLHNLKTAYKQGVKTTANGSRGYGSSVGIAPSNFYIVPGTFSEKEMLEKLGNGIVITDLQGLHAGADSISGDFSLSAKGILVKNGETKEAVKQITVAGNFYKLLMSIEAVGNDLEFGLPSAVSIGCPSLLVGEMPIAGK